MHENWIDNRHAAERSDRAMKLQYVKQGGSASGIAVLEANGLASCPMSIPANRAGLHADLTEAKRIMTHAHWPSPCAYSSLVLDGRRLARPQVFDFWTPMAGIPLFVGDCQRQPTGWARPKRHS